jgi:hypothetical protein
MRLISFGSALMLAVVGLADTVTLKSGRVIHGNYLGGTARQVRLDAGDRIETLDVSDITKIEFSGAAETPPRAENRPVLRRENVMNPDPAPAPARGPVELPAGTNLVVRLIDGVDSETARPGQTFAASLDEPVMIGGEAVIPRGADVLLKLVDAKDSGKLTGRAELTLDLVSVRVNGRMVEINTQTISRESDSRGERTAKVAGGTAAVGAIIGAIAGGGKGAAIGAVAGGAAGAGAEMVTKGQRVKIPSETRLTFVLDTPVRI